MFRLVARAARRGKSRVLVAAALLLCFDPSRAATPNSAPVISGQPKTYVALGKTYAFLPTASDPDGDSLSFRIANKPAWMWFDTRTGKLSGIPQSAQAGRTFPGIRIYASDGTTSVALPSFWITVGQSSTGTTANRAPRISGTPVTSATVGRPYAFRPGATDADGDPLTFSITGKPAWASFDPRDGTLYGTPPAAGTYSNIVIRVSDGTLATSLPAFAIQVTTSLTHSVTLQWTPPTSNTDGTSLTNLSGYTVHYGRQSRTYESSVWVSGARTTSATLQGLSSGTWYFAVKSRTSSGVQSAYSAEVVKTL